MQLYLNIRYISGFKTALLVVPRSLSSGHSLLLLGDGEAILPVAQTKLPNIYLSLKHYIQSFTKYCLFHHINISKIWSFLTSTLAQVTTLSTDLSPSF